MIVSLGLMWLKVKGLDIYIPPLTGKSWPAAVYNRSGVLTGSDTSGAAQVAAAHCPNERTLEFGPRSL